MRDKLENALKKGSFSEEVFLRCCRAQEFYYESQIPVTQGDLHKLLSLIKFLVRHLAANILHLFLTLKKKRERSRNLHETVKLTILEILLKE